MSLTSLDEVDNGDWLVCIRGPRQTVVDRETGKTYQRTNHDPEGVLVQVLAVNPPVLLVRCYPTPCGDNTHDHTPWVGVFLWDQLEWSHANKRYVREYLKAAGIKRPSRSAVDIVSSRMKRLNQSGQHGFPGPVDKPEGKW